MRFKLDPNAPEVERPHVPPPAPPGTVAKAPTPTPPLPTPRPAPATGAAPADGARNRRLLIIGAIAVASLLVLGGVAYGAYTLLGLGYPDKYLVDADEMPEGMSEARLTSQERDQVGIEENPGRMSEDRLDDFAARNGARPDEGWTQVLGDSSGGTQRVAVVALQYANEEDAKSGASQLRALCSFAGGAVLRDGDVVVAVVPDGNGMRSSVPVVARIVQDKSGATTVCGL